LFDLIGAVCAVIIFLVPYLIARLVGLLSGREEVVEERVGRRGKVLRLSRLPGTWPRGPLFTGVQEFPKLLLWLRGDWSLVGIVPFDAARWAELPERYRRFPPDAAPGWITLAGEATGRSLEEICAANTEYASRWSLALDMTLLLERLRRKRGIS
jgi:lipopolysaccharide/colanic/teichoic acid biosynthesis glycosyltransferase